MSNQGSPSEELRKRLVTVKFMSEKEMKKKMSNQGSSEWEKKFERRFHKVWFFTKTVSIAGDYKLKKKVKAFVRNLLKAERERVLDRVKLEKRVGTEKIPLDDIEKGYNLAVSDLEALIARLKKEE